MKKIKLMLAIALLPFALLAQKGHGHGKHGGGHGNGHGNKHDKIVIYSQPNVIVVNEKKAKPYKVKYRHGNPNWGPSNGYKHRYVYFPQHYCYYDNQEGIYIYKKGVVWTSSLNRPSFIINIGDTRKVELDIDDEPKPQIYFEQHISLYR